MTETDADTVAAQFLNLLARVAAGEEVVITRGGEPVARLVPPVPRRRRIVGLLAGRIAPADIHDGDDEVLEMFDESARSDP